MGIFLEGALKTEETELTVVWSEDPAVEVPAELVGCGWVPADKCRLKRGADRVVIRALGPHEWARYRDKKGADGDGTAMLFITETGTVRVNDAKKRSATRTWVQALSMVVEGGQNAKGAAHAHDLLGMRIIGLSRGVPVENTYRYARIILGYEEDDKAKVDEAKADADAGESEEGPGTSGPGKSSE